MNQPEVNLGAIRSGTVLIEKGALLPEPVRLEDRVMGTGWAPVAEDPERRMMAGVLSATGWTFFSLAHSIRTTACGFDRPRAIQKALLRLIGAAKHEECNAFEIDHVGVDSFCGFQYVSLSAHPRHIQKGLVLGSAT